LDLLLQKLIWIKDHAMIGADTLATPQCFIYISRDVCFTLWASWEITSCAAPWCCNVRSNKRLLVMVFSFLLWIILSKVGVRCI
jgi:hypothetical protein